MDGLFKTVEAIESEEEFSFRKLFAPLTTTKAITWIVIIGLVVYANMLFNSFVWDDRSYIDINPQVHQVNIIESFKTNLFNSGGQYRPLPELYFSILYFLFGSTVFPYHLLQLVFHIGVAIVIFLFFQRFFTKKISLFSALLFLVHPINVESVSYIGQTDSPLFALFGFIPLLILTKKRLLRKDIFIIFSLLLLSLLIKETGILFIFLVLIYSLLFKKDLFGRLVMGSLIVLCIYAYLRFFVGHVDLSARSFTPIASLTLSERIFQVPAIIFFYLKTFFYPSFLAIDQEWTIKSATLTTFYLPILFDCIFFLVIAIGGLYLRKYHKNIFLSYLFFSLWFIIGLLFHVQIFPLDMTVADRWFYFPIIGLVGIFIILYQFVLPRIPNYKKVSVILAVLIISVLSIRTIIRNVDWQNNVTLFTHDIKNNDNYDIENNLGVIYENLGEYPQAVEHLQRSIDLRKNKLPVHNLGLTYLAMGNIQKAKQMFAWEIQEKDSLPPYHVISLDTDIKYGEILVIFEKSNASLPFIKNALHNYPNSPDLWDLLALIYCEQNKKKLALEAATTAYQLDQNNTSYNIYIHLVNNQQFQINPFGKEVTFP